MPYRSECDNATVSRFEYENTLMHYGRVNKRSMITTIAVCITFIIVTAIFVVAYTVRERNWQEMFQKLVTPAITEVSDGIHEQPNP